MVRHAFNSARLDESIRCRLILILASLTHDRNCHSHSTARSASTIRPPSWSCNGKFYTYGTGGSSWSPTTAGRGGAELRLPRRGLAPDVIHLGDRYYMYVAANIGAQPKAAINMIWSKTLDPNSPDYKWEEGGVVASSDGVEDCNAIDPGVFLDPNDGRLWLIYGSYFGYIRLVELDPKTGKRLNPNDKPRNLAINCEASIMIYHDGWYYLLATHGSCCRGADSGYNIRVGRAKKVTGPFLDHEGIDMIQGGGKLFARFRRTRDRPRPFRPARSGRWRAEILDALRSRSGPRRRQRARYPPAACGKMAGRSPARISKKALTRSNPCAPARRWNWRWRACRSAAAPRRRRGGGSGARWRPARRRAAAG